MGIRGTTLFARRVSTKQETTPHRSQVEPSDRGTRRPNGGLLHDHLLSLILVGLFIVSLAGQFYFQYQQEVNEAIIHGETAPTPGSKQFLDSFLASVFENWQSEFLQVFAFVVLTAYFIHRGSHESPDGSDEMASDIRAIKEKLGA
ncbi:MAG TPA: DUF6766 family protein [Acidimicrobiia bacterium]|nr:DUF6766 family protein [Acidimicrobiia bacterium]